MLEVLVPGGSDDPDLEKMSIDGSPLHMPTGASLPGGGRSGGAGFHYMLRDLCSSCSRPGAVCSRRSLPLPPRPAGKPPPGGSSIMEPSLQRQRASCTPWCLRALRHPPRYVEGTQITDLTSLNTLQTLRTTYIYKG